MRILIANKYVRITGGADKHCRDVVAALLDRGHDVAYLASDSAAGVVDCYAAVGEQVTHESRDRASLRDARSIAFAGMWNRRAVGATDALIEKFGPDLVHVHKLYPQLSVAPVVAAHRRGIPVVQTLHDYEFIAASPLDHTGDRLDRTESRLRYRALNTALFGVKRIVHMPRITGWIAVSRRLATIYEKHGIDAKVLPNFGVGMNSEVPGFADRDGLLFVGRLTEEKGILDVLTFAERHPEIPVLFAGAGPLQAMVEAASINRENVRYFGTLTADGVRDAMEAARVVAMPSKWEEPGPLTAIEAMMSGVPIVAYDNGGLAEYVRDADAGLVTKANDGALSDAVRVLYYNESKWQVKSLNGRRAAGSVHSVLKYVTELEIFYRAAIASREA